MPASKKSSDKKHAAEVAKPRRSRPKMPKGYGIPTSERGMLPWRFVEEQMSNARNYWIGTTRPDGRPHATPVWGAWLDGTLYFEGSPQTRRGRNLAANPALVVHLESADQVVILEGEAFEIRQPDRSLAARLAEAMSAKYKAVGYRPSPEQWDNGGLYVVRPRAAFAWTQFPKNTTRWLFSVD